MRRSKVKPLRLKSVWLVTWTGSHQRVKPPVALLDYRKSTRTVAEFIEKLYAVYTYTPEEQLRLMVGAQGFEPWTR